MRGKFFATMDDPYIHNLTKDYFEIHRGDHGGIIIADQLKYKFLVVMDG